MAPNKDKEVNLSWSHGEMIGGDRHKVNCNYCHKVLYGGIYRLKCSLCHIFGDAKGCTNVPTEVRQQMRTHVLGKKVNKEKKRKELVE